MNVIYFHQHFFEGVVGHIHIIEFDLCLFQYRRFYQTYNIFLKFALQIIGIALTHKYDVIFTITDVPL